MRNPPGQRLRAIEHADIIEAEKAAFENVQPLRVLAIHPPSKIQQQLVKYALEKFAVRFSAHAPSIS